MDFDFVGVVGEHFMCTEGVVRAMLERIEEKM